MSNSHEQSLDENVVFLPVTEASPEFLHCERERQALERLLSAGPEAFYGSIGTERSGCFLSPEEVSQITGWARDYRVNPLPVVHREENGVEDGLGLEDFHSTYFPAHSDMPTPDLELGWPEKAPWVPKASVTVHTNPPAEGQAPVREIIRRNLQNASLVIAIVTDRLTDGVIIGDLHNAASRGVAVYIILNQRSIQENFTLNRLRHPNMQVRVLGGKSFCTKTGRMVVGEMKDKFILVDLETVIHGSYSLTWTDAHLHRQLVTVLHGPVVESFDREFRILFAASLPISDTWRVANSHVDMGHQLKDLSGLRFQKHLPLESEFGSPPSPPTDSLLDWEAMGVLQRDCISPENPLGQHEEIFVEEIPLQNNVMFSKNPPHMDGFVNGNRFVKRRINENISPVANNVPERSTSFHNKPSSPTDLPSPEDVQCVDRIIEKTLARQLSIEKNANLEDRRNKQRLVLKVEEPTNNMMMLSSAKSRERLQREPILERDSGSDKSSPTVENKPLSRKPIILRMPQSESFSSINDIMMRLQPLQSPSAGLSRGPKGVVTEVSRSMMDLSAHNTDRSPDGSIPVPRIRTSTYDPSEVSSALTLMKKRNDDLKPSLYRSPKVFVPRERPRSTALTLDWRKSLAEIDGEQK